MSTEEQAFQDYFLAIEEHLGRRRGKPLLLSPRDVALVREWNRAGLPLEAVIRGIDRFFGREARRTTPRRGTVTLAYVETDVVICFEELKAARLGPTLPEPAAGEHPSATAEARLRGAAQSLRGAASRAGDGQLGTLLEQTAERLEQLLSKLRGEAPTAATESELGKLERRLERALLERLDGEQTEALHAAAQQELGAYAGRLNKRRLRELQQLAERRRLFARHGLPFLTALLD
jgi:hypothetical protein